MDPNGVTPLAGVVELTTDEPARVRLDIDDGIDSWAVRFPDSGTDHALPLLGLKADNMYTVQVTLTDADGSEVTLDPTLQAVTNPLPPDFPTIDVLVMKPDRMEPGFTLLDRFSRGRGATGNSYTIIVDHNGEVVWFSTLGQRVMKQLSNGNLQYRAGLNVLEIDMLGAEISRVTLQDPNDGLHHDLFNLADGGFLSLSRQPVVVDGYPTSETDPTAPTQTATIRDEPVVEFGPDGGLRDVWPLTDLLDPRRIGYGSLSPVIRGDELDWAHDNAVLHDTTDDSIIVSVRHQDAVVKFSRRTGELKWILGPHANWSAEFQPFLLQPVGEPFEWQFHQHAPMLTDKGTLILHDNGNFRASPFDGTTPVPDQQNHSRAVEYRIDEDAMTVRQVWEHGGNVTEPVYSPSRGDADWLPITGNALITYSDVRVFDGKPSQDQGLGASHTRLMEVGRETPAEKVFEFVMFNPATDANINVVRSERIPSLYARDVDVNAALVGVARTDMRWSTIPASSRFLSPVVIAGPPTFNEPDDGVVRVRAVSGTDFEMRFQEWDYRERILGDTSHVEEDIPFVVLPSGQHAMSDGSVWEVGTFPLGKTGSWQEVNFRTIFANRPHVFLTLQSSNGGSAVGVRARDVDNGGFEAALFEEEALMDGHTQETVGYLAIASSAGSGLVTLNGQQTPYLLQRVTADHRWVPTISQRLKLEEEQSRDAEMDHVDENLDVLILGNQIFAQIVTDNGGDTVALRRLPPEYLAPLEWGTVDGVNDGWTTVPLVKPFTKPVVVAKAVSARGQDPGVVRVRNVTGDSFEMSYQEWRYLNGRHIEERVFYMVAEAGRTQVAGLDVEARRLHTDLLLLDGFRTVSFTRPFAAPPAVFTGVMTERGSDPVTTRVDGLSATGFSLTMDEEEAKVDGHVLETLGWIAIERGSGTTADGREIAVGGATADDQPATTALGLTAKRRFPVLLGDIVTTNESDPVFLRYRKLTPSTVELFLQEEQSLDDETAHVTEDVSIFAAE